MDPHICLLLQRDPFPHSFGLIHIHLETVKFDMKGNYDFNVKVSENALFLRRFFLPLSMGRKIGCSSFLKCFLSRQISLMIYDKIESKLMPTYVFNIYGSMHLLDALIQQKIRWCAMAGLYTWVPNIILRCPLANLNIRAPTVALGLTWPITFTFIMHSITTTTLHTSSLCR